MKGYTTREVSQLLGIPARVIRSYARSGLLSDSKADGYRHHFNFQDIIVLRTAKELRQTGIAPGKISAVLGQLRRELPLRKPLTSLRISGHGGMVVVQDNQDVYSPESGQYHFNFSVAELAGSVAPITRKAVREAEVEVDRLTSDDWFDLGLDLEAVSPIDAPSAYLRALEADPHHADAHVNLGRLLQESGDLRAAEFHYRQAIAAEPGHALASFNLGTLLEDLGKTEDAIKSYQAADGVADAHFNLSRLYALQGKHSESQYQLNLFRGLMDPK